MPAGPSSVAVSIVGPAAGPPPVEPHWSSPLLSTCALSFFAETVEKYVESATSRKLPLSVPPRDLPALPVQPFGTMPLRAAPSFFTFRFTAP